MGVGTPASPELQRGVRLFNAGFYWEAHEAWEQAWIPDRQGPDRGFYKGLIQVAAGCLHYTRQNRKGALLKWQSGADFLRPYLPRHHGLELERLVQRIDECRERLAASSTWPALELPSLASV